MDGSRQHKAAGENPTKRFASGAENGGVYRLPVDYTILTYAADPEQLPDCRPETVLRACEQGDDTLYPFARNSDYSSQMAKRCAIDYVDAAQETCNFECDSFYAQLALLRRQQEALDALPKILTLLPPVTAFYTTTSFYPQTASSISRDAMCTLS